MNEEHIKFLDIIERQLAVEPFSIDGVLQKYVVFNSAQNTDAQLLELLLQNDELKEKFFKKVAGALVFDRTLFIWYLEQKKFLNDSYTAYKNKIGLTIGGKYLQARDEVALAWPFKDCHLEGGQSREECKRDEIFFNEVLAHDEITQLLMPKVLTGAAAYDKTGKQSFQKFTRNAEINKSRDLPGATITDNLIIKGNNLLALHSLKEEFARKVKLIYIDPPYNTGGDANIFTYNNNFNHSAWLTFMRNRLEAAREMLRHDGFIAIAIDHTELFYLGVLADEVFGRENRLGVVCVLTNPRGRQFTKFFSHTTDYMLVYANNKELARFNQTTISKEKRETFDQEDKLGRYRFESFMRMANIENKIDDDDYHYPIYVSGDLSVLSLENREGYHEIYPFAQEVKKVWDVKKSTFLSNMQSDKEEYVARVDYEGNIGIYKKYREQQMFLTHWFEKKYNATYYGTRLLQTILGKKLFSYPKSIHTVFDTIKIMTGENDIIMDFFAGSGTTGHAVLELNKEDGGNRQFILVEQLEEHISVCKERITKVIKNENSDAGFVYVELKKHNEQFMEDIQDADTTKKLLAVWKKIKKHSFVDYNLDIKKQNEHMEDFKQLTLDEQKQHLCEILDKNQLYVNLTALNDREIACTADEKKISKDFYQQDK